MPEIYVLIALLMAGIAAALRVAPHLRLLNFVDYDGARSVAGINRYAALRLLLPVIVNAGCACFAAMRPEWSVPLIFPAIVSILAAVVWIAAGATRLKS